MLAGKDFSEIFGAEAESDSSDSSDSTVSEDEEEEVAEEDEEEDTSDEESNELSPVVEVVAAETAESRPPGGPQEVSETGMSPAPPGEKTSPPEVMSNEVVQRKRHESLDEDEAPSDGRSEPEKAEKPTQSRGLSSAARAAIRHHASRCRSFIAAGKLAEQAPRRAKGEAPQKQKEELKNRSLSHASKRARKETPAIPA